MARPIELFLAKYQTDKVMIPFIAEDLEKLLLRRTFSQESPDVVRRLDIFFMSLQPKYPNAWAVVSKLLLLSHSQAQVERGFTINKDIACANLSEETLVSRRLVNDYILYVGGMEKIPSVVNNKLIALGMQARSRYMEHLEEKKKANIKEEKEGKRKAAQKEVHDLERKKQKLESERNFLFKDSYKQSDKAENTGQNSFLTKANALRRAAVSKDEDIKTIEKSINEKTLCLQAML